MAPCTPPLKLVANGPAGAPLVAPLDPNDLPIMDENPGFSDLATSLLGDAGSDTDGFDAVVADAAAGADLIDAAGAAMDAVLDAILLALEAADDSTIDPGMSLLSEDQTTGAEKLAGISGALPFSPPPNLPLTTQAGGGTQTVLYAGDQQQNVVFRITDYQFWLQKQYSDPVLAGPNPPFVAMAGWARGDDPAHPFVDVVLTINPTAEGTFNADLALKQFKLVGNPPVLAAPVQVIGTYIASVPFTVLARG
jgi:hypothetical protein